MMNERIRELAEQQGLTGPNYLISSRELEKFAELLIKECILVARNAENEDEVYAWYAISNHFGVEE
jgi:hypothetical protein